MATKLYAIKNSGADLIGWGGVPLSDPNSSSNAQCFGLSSSPGASATTAQVSTPTGPTNGISICKFISPPLTASVTISGTITYNIWGNEASMNTNAGFQGLVYKMSNAGTLTLISNKEFGTEMSTSNTANNFTDAAPTSTSLNKGDRLVWMICINDAGGTLASASPAVTLSFQGPTSGAAGDTWVQFTETFSLATALPAGTKYYLRSTASDLGGAGQKSADTTAGSASANLVTTIPNGTTSGVQITDTGGGQVLEWFTPQLNAFTLSDTVKFNVRAKVGLNGNTEAIRGEVAICDGDGSNPTVWGTFGQRDNNSSAGQMAINTTTDAAQSGFITGPDTSVTAGQRLRLRIYLDEGGSSSALQSSASPLTISYDGGTPAAVGDTWFQLTNSVTTFVAAIRFSNPIIFQDPAIL